MIAGVALSMAACAGITADNANYVEDAGVVTYKAEDMNTSMKMDRTARIERAYNDSLRK